MIIIDLPKSEYRRVDKGEPPRRWSWDWIDWVIAVAPLLLFALAACGGGLRIAIGGMLGVGIWIAGFYWRPLSWLAFIGRVAGLQ